MIDTDKYTGHTPAPWNADCAEPDAGLIANIDAYGEEGDVCVARMVNGCLADTQLIADAPLLLAEVNDLLAEIRQLNNIIGAFDDFMCNNWTPANVHSLWNELLTKEEEE
jgi:hypothetical protein